MNNLSLKPATRAVVGSSRHRTAGERGFAIITTLMLMVLLAVLALGMLSLSSISLRSSFQTSAQSVARDNARMALMIAIGELQKEMGPDMRVSAKAAIFDQDPTTEAIEGVDQPQWLASYDSWGGWLNASYNHPETGTAMAIADTYTPKRANMFRRWLLSLPVGMEDDIDAPMTPPTGWDDTNSVVLVGAGSTGSAAQETRAYLNAVTTVGETGRSAWWISPENHKARIDKATKPRTLSPDQWETAQGDTAGSGVGALAGLSGLDPVAPADPADPTDPAVAAAAAISDKLVSLPTLVPAGIDDADMKSHFFDLTEASRGVLASVRTGHLKKDLSLLFDGPEGSKSDLPDLYRFDPIDVREPSIRPMSAEIANRAVLKERHFASWTSMRHFYRMYRQDSDVVTRTYSTGGTNSSPFLNCSPGLKWDGIKPWTGCNINLDIPSVTPWPWPGEDTYVRYPILTNITYIISLQTYNPPADGNDGTYALRVVSTPVRVYWNPYNVELRVPDKHMAGRVRLTNIHPIDREFFLNDVSQDIDKKPVGYGNESMRVSSGNSPLIILPDIIFKPGQFRIFSPPKETVYRSNVGGTDSVPGFNPAGSPNAFGGQYVYLPGTNSSTTDTNAPQYPVTPTPKIQLRFSYKFINTNNFMLGNTPASFNFAENWANQGSFDVQRYLPFSQQVDWFNTSQLFTYLSDPATKDAWIFDGALLPIAYFQLALKGIGVGDYPSIDWEQDWRCRNWLQAPPFYHGKGLYMSEDSTIGHTQRIDSPFELRFGPLLSAGKDVDDIIQHIGESALMGSGDVTAVSSLELPSAPIGSLGGFGAMAIDPGWVNLTTLNPDWKRALNTITGVIEQSLYRAATKASAYQSGITGPGIGNSFVHPMIPRTDVYQFLDNSISMDMNDLLNSGHTANNTKAYCDYWDHVLLLNDALWDDYFVSSLADQTRPSEAVNVSLDKNLDKLVNGEELANSRYLYHGAGKSDTEVKTELKAADGYLKAAAHLMVDGMFNVNSTSVPAWTALFAGIRERQVVYRDASGTLKPVAVPAGKRIALSRFGVETTDKEGDNPESGVARDDGMLAWSGVRFLDDAQILKLAQECVKQVKQRGPFLNFSEFINRRLADNDLGTMGALQSAIDYDDASPQLGSINYQFKSHPDYMLSASQLGTTSFETPEAAVGSRFAGIPGYVIQSDLLRPIANTLSVRDDTFRIRAYGDSLDANGNIIARAWCEAVVQRAPEYCDETNSPEVPARLMSEAGEFSDNAALTPTNRRFGRKFHIASFRWLSGSEI